MWMLSIGCRAKQDDAPKNEVSPEAHGKQLELLPGAKMYVFGGQSRQNLAPLSAAVEPAGQGAQGEANWYDKEPTISSARYEPASHREQLR